MKTTKESQHKHTETSSHKKQQRRKEGESETEAGNNMESQSETGGMKNPLLQQLFTKDVVWLKSNATILEAAKLMLENHIGDVVIVEEKGDKTIPIGIVTDRDIVIKTTAREIPPDSIKVSDVMTKNLVTATESDDIMDILEMMTQQGVSRLPVMNNEGHLIGILTSKKLYKYFAQGLCDLSSLSEKQQEREEEMRH